MVKLKKIPKKKLKEPDEFITSTEKAYLFVKDHAKPIAISGVILVVLILSIFIYTQWSHQKEVDADRRLASILELYQGVRSPYREGSPENYKTLLAKFDETIQQFPRTSAGKLSYLYKGNVHLQLGEFDEAKTAFQTFLKKGTKGKLLRSLGLEGLGYAYEGKKEYEEALKSYQKIVEMGAEAQMVGVYLRIGHCYEKQGKNKEALENYKAFLKASPKSPAANSVLRKISSLEG
jgi:tetratricopeptide (TPR) repeat protein